MSEMKPNTGNAAGDSTAGAPADLPTDPEQKLCYVIGDLIRDKAQALHLGNRAELVALAAWVVRAVEGAGLAQLPRPTTETTSSETASSPELVAASCLTCLQCSNNFNSCTGTYTQCKAAYDACLNCPCH